ncbi:hypothetical protein Kpol_1071p4 [Vanderwaltozyma polyspora DSM 70294]|uniref:V-type proton ATPase subunit E n=1 Tax=Vanderwaltozyma polyspora (strain ATCC 22028 / DSM 70294 / BCRC 21397 / CBS 2163 / NBRC 10782 / NRRL Y-8283 / UCD 57-17) TaxID=436907 RepID=A7TRJ9_VANPO|nr:uncharacterized protein Kpol_1071p4 [Vanderwaltozyma polyspora DSM 70294]EDO15097.1 hypothetical protein Kpol_1071p4 [Vanderwaltozyma polyspora DSM 70294]
MSAITSLTPNQVNDELLKMQAFIKKEADEKGKEIMLKADQEYEIEKNEILRKEINNIDNNFNDKMKKSILKQQITKSTIKNKYRLNLLSEREKLLDEIFEKTKKDLIKVTNDKNKYSKVLKSLILEAAMKLLESNVIVKAKKSDCDLLNKLTKEIEDEFEKSSNRKIKITILKDSYLDETLIGGVIVSDLNGKIEIDNTLEERLKLLSEEALPAIRLELFGPSKTRKFFD